MTLLGRRINAATEWGAQRVATKREINVDTLVSTSTRRGRH